MSNPAREYRSVMFALTKILSHRRQGQFSYVWSESKGRTSNSGSGLAGSGANALRNPNIALVNSYGFMEEDRTHEFKVMGGYTVPKIEVALNAYYRGISGRNHTPNSLVSGSVLNWAGSLSINLEPRGSQRYETWHQIDLRVEKEFRIDVHELGVFFDFQNLFNNDTVTAVRLRVPARTLTDSATGEDVVVKYQSPTALISPTQMTWGARWSFYMRDRESESTAGPARTAAIPNRGLLFR